MTGQLARADVGVVPVWRDRCLLRAGTPVTCTGLDGRAVLDAADQTALLGLDGAGPSRVRAAAPARPSGAGRLRCQIRVQPSSAQPAASGRLLNSAERDLSASGSLG
jgi:hypothetical protein